MTIDAPDPGHGHSPAAWTTVIILMAAFALGTIFFSLDLPWAVVGCAVLAVCGLIVGYILRRLGFGVHGDRARAKVH